MTKETGSPASLGKPDFNDDVMEGWAQLTRLSQSMLAAVEADLKAAGQPSLTWYDILLELERAEPVGLRPYQLQDRLLLAQYNLSRVTDRMIKAGLIDRAPCADDGRGHVLRISVQGLTVRGHMWPLYRDAVTRHFGGRLSKDQVTALRSALQGIS